MGRDCGVSKDQGDGVTTTTDMLIATISKALEQRRPHLDAGLPLASVSLVVKLDRKSGRPRELIFRSEDTQSIQCGLPPSA